MVHPEKWRKLLLGFLLLFMSVRYLSFQPVKLVWSTGEAYLMRFQWLESVNLYLDTGKLLMYPPDMRLEDVATGEDQGYPFILSFVGSLTNVQKMNFGNFVRFNYLLFVLLGVAASLLLYAGFESLLVAVVFFFFYLRTNIYTGGLDHNW